MYLFGKNLKQIVFTYDRCWVYRYTYTYIFCLFSVLSICLCIYSSAWHITCVLYKQVYFLWGDIGYITRQSLRHLPVIVTPARGSSGLYTAVSMLTTTPSGHWSQLDWWPTQSAPNWLDLILHPFGHLGHFCSLCDDWGPIMPFYMQAWMASWGRRGPSDNKSHTSHSRMVYKSSVLLN